MSFPCLWPGRPFFGWVRNTSVTLQKRLFWRGRPFLMICWMDGWWFLFMTLKLDIWRSKQNKAGDLVTITETCWVIANRLVFKLLDVPAHQLSNFDYSWKLQGVLNLTSLSGFLWLLTNCPNQAGLRLFCIFEKIKNNHVDVFLFKSADCKVNRGFILQDLLYLVAGELAQWKWESITLQQKTAYINTKLAGFLSKRSRRNWI